MLSTLPSLRAALGAALSLVALGLAPAVASADATVNITGSALDFTPDAVTIDASQQVTWNFAQSTSPHNIVFLPEGAAFPASTPTTAAEFTFLGSGSPPTFPKSFPQAGTFRYLCSFHYGGNDPMRGTVTVNAAGPPPPPPPVDTAPLPPEQIAFTSDQITPGAKDVFSVKGDLGQKPRLTANLSSDDSAPAISPDGTRIAFQSNRDATVASDAHIFVMNADGSDETNLTPGDLSRNAGPAWSPDGTKIAFSSDRTGNGDIYVMNADGTGVRQLTSELSEDLEPTWSRDGTKIAFTSDRDGPRNVWTIDVDPAGAGLGTNPKSVAEGQFGLDAPAFSPTANRVAYAKARGAFGAFDICVAGLDAAVPVETCLTSKSNPDEDPAWSPDGTQILFSRGTGADRDLFLLTANTADSERPVTSVGDNSRFQEPAWGPAVVSPPGPPAPTPTPTPAPAPGPSGGGGGEPEDTRPDPGVAAAPGAFLGLDQPRRTRMKGFRRLGLVVTARCVGVETGTVKLALGAKLARKLGLKKKTLASAPARCGADKKASAVLKPGAKVRKALATVKARKALKRARGLKTTVTIALAGAGRTLRATLPVLIRS